MQEYALGFIFNQSLNKVLLIHKQRPEWQAGKINGLGGKIEVGESGLDCIVREIQEETGLSIPQKDWVFMGQVNAPIWTMEVFTCNYQGSMDDAKSLESEQVEWFEIGELPANVIGNLRWFIPLALDMLTHGEPKKINVEY